jgi:hypothetical protein
MSVLSRVDNSNGRLAGPAALDESWDAAFPALYEYLIATTWPDGKPREVSTLLVLAEQGKWKGMLNDRANSRVAWFSGDSVETLLATIDRGLRDGGADWRASRPGGPRVRGR